MFFADLILKKNYLPVPTWLTETLSGQIDEIGHPEIFCMGEASVIHHATIRSPKAEYDACILFYAFVRSQNCAYTQADTYIFLFMIDSIFL